MVYEVDAYRWVRKAQGMNTVLENATTDRVGELTAMYQTTPIDFHPLIAEAIQRFGPLGAVTAVSSAMERQLAMAPKPQAKTAAALMRGLGARERLKQEEGGSYSAEETRHILGISKAAVLKRYQKGQLLGWREAGQGAVRFPVWQFKDGDVLPGLREVLAVFAGCPWADDWTKILFFLQRRHSLDGTRPLDFLRKGKIDEIRGLAEDTVE